LILQKKTLQNNIIGCSLNTQKTYLCTILFKFNFENQKDQHVHVTLIIVSGNDVTKKQI